MLKIHNGMASFKKRNVDSTLLHAAGHFLVWKQMTVLTVVAHHQRAELD